MDLAKLNTAIVEAQRFLDRAETLRSTCSTFPFGGGTEIDGDTKQTASVRRASMDLTRALADLRKYN